MIFIIYENALHQGLLCIRNFSYNASNSLHNIFSLLVVTGNGIHDDYNYYNTFTRINRKMIIKHTFTILFFSQLNEPPNHTVVTNRNEKLNNKYLAIMQLLVDTAIKSD